MDPAATPATPADSLELAIEGALCALEEDQAPSGAWPGDYGGPQFLLPLYLVTAHLIRLELPEGTRADMLRYIREHQNPDGSWGLHVEAAGYVYTTSVNYVALRLLGVDASAPELQRARQWLHARGGPLASAPWGKFVLALMNLYDYSGLNPVQPELWLLPESLPIHPSRLWCHCRMVYLPMSYLYGRRYKAEETELVTALREELYAEAYDRIDWAAHRNRIAVEDTYVAPTPLLRVVNEALLGYEAVHSQALRERALAFVVDQVDREDRNTDYICIGPINKLLNTLVWQSERPGGREVQEHIRRLPDYLYASDDGIRMNGYNNSELWDTAFAAQAIVAARRNARAHQMIENAHRYIESNQVLDDVPDRARAFRDPSRGGWPFSNRAHGWPITDCTAEGLKASLLFEPLVADPISVERLTDAAELLLYFQNDDGGWATYERTRAPTWLERLNPSGCFDAIMIDYSYVECTSASMQALVAFDKRYGGRLSPRIRTAVDRGVEFLLAAQREDGSFEGSWGVCFTYGTWFGVNGLLVGGVRRNHPAIRRAVQYLVSKQAADGGWSESVESCRERRYVPTERSQPVQTAWAVLSLIAAGEADSDAVRRGIEFLKSRQTPDGRFPQDTITGVFNKTCAIHYDNYPKIFPLWALSEYEHAQAPASVRRRRV